MTIDSAWAQAGSMSWPSNVRGATAVERAQMKSFLGACAKHGTTAPTHAARTSAAIDPRFIRLLLRVSSRGIENWVGRPRRGVALTALKTITDRARTVKVRSSPDARRPL